MAEGWRLEHGQLSGLAIGTVVLLVTFGDDLRVLSPEGGVLLRLRASEITQESADGGLTLRLTSPRYGIDAFLSEVAVQVGSGAPGVVPLVWQPTDGAPPPAVLVRTYRGSSPAIAAQQMTADTSRLAPQGYYPVSQSWAASSYGSGFAVVGVLFLIVVVLGLLFFVDLLVVMLVGAGVVVLLYAAVADRDGSLTVTYQLREPGAVPATPPSALPADDTKVCPRCAETVKAAALVCRYCGHEFEAQAAPSSSQSVR